MEKGKIVIGGLRRPVGGVGGIERRIRSKSERKILFDSNGEMDIPANVWLMWDGGMMCR